MPSAYYLANKEKILKQTKEYRDANKEIISFRRKLARYGIDKETWQELFKKQGFKCACCDSTDPKSKVGWATDHDHVTGKVRGILCSPCNILLGQVGDNQEGLDKTYRRFTIYLSLSNGD